MPNDHFIPDAKFFIGQVVHHRKFHYRGVICDVDSIYQGTDDWYEAVAKSKPPKEQPWYHVLVHGAEFTTYDAQRNLEQDETSEPVVHPLIDEIFSSLENGIYRSRQTLS